MAKLLFFGPLSELAENGEAPLPDHVRDTHALIDWLGSRDPELGEALRTNCARIIVNNTVAAEGAAITDADEIGFLPPLSGG